MDDIGASFAQRIAVRGHRDEAHFAGGPAVDRSPQVLGNRLRQHRPKGAIKGQPAAALVGEDCRAQDAFVLPRDPESQGVLLHPQEFCRARRAHRRAECPAGDAASVMDDIARLANNAPAVDHGPSGPGSVDKSADDCLHGCTLQRGSGQHSTGAKGRGRCPPLRGAVDPGQR